MTDSVKLRGNEKIVALESGDHGRVVALTNLGRVFDRVCGGSWHDITPPREDRPEPDGVQGTGRRSGSGVVAG